MATEQQFLDFRYSMTILQYQLAVSAAQNVMTHNILRTSMNLEGPVLTDPTGAPLINPPSDPFSFLLPIGQILDDLFAVTNFDNEENLGNVIAAAQLALNGAIRTYPLLAAALSGFFSMPSVQNNMVVPAAPANGGTGAAPAVYPTSLQSLHLEVISPSLGGVGPGNVYDVFYAWLNSVNTWEQANGRQPGSIVGSITYVDGRPSDPISGYSRSHSVSKVEDAIGYARLYARGAILDLYVIDFQPTINSGLFNEVGGRADPDYFNLHLDGYFGTLAFRKGEYILKGYCIPAEADINVITASKADQISIYNWAKDVDTYARNNSKKITVYIIPLPA